MLGWSLAFGIGLLAAVWGEAAMPPPRPQNLDCFTRLGPPREDPRREWTLLYYMNGDNNLEHTYTETFPKIEEFLLRNPRISQASEIILLFDRTRGYGHTAWDGGWTDTRLFRMRPQQAGARMSSELLADCGELNMGDPATLQAFIAAGARAFPAKHYAVVLDDHGGGWHDCANDSDAPNAPGGHDELTLPRLQSALRGALQALGRPRLDFLIFDMCLMGQLDVAAAVKDFTEIAVFSEAIDRDNLMWQAFLTCAFDQDPHDLRGIARRMPERWGSYYRDRPEALKLATLSAVDCTKVDPVLGAMNALLGKLLPEASHYWPTFSRALYHAERYTTDSDLEKGTDATASIDLLNAIGRMKANCRDFPADAEYQQLKAATEQCILASFAGFRYRRSTGLAVYGPLRGVNYNPQYDSQPLAQLTAWPKFLQALHAMQAQHPDVPKFHSVRIQDRNGQPSNTVVPLYGNWCYFVLEGSNLLQVNVAMGTESPGLGYLIWYRTRRGVARALQEWRDVPESERYLRMPAYRDGKSILAQELPGILLQIASDDHAVPATVVALEGNETAIVRGWYSHPSNQPEVEVEVIFDTNTWTVSEVRAHVREQPGGETVTQAFDPAPDGFFRPRLELMPYDGEPGIVPAGKIRWGRGPRLVVNLVPPGEQVLTLEAVSIPGQTAKIHIPFRCEPNTAIERDLKSGQKLTAPMLAGKWDWQILQSYQHQQGQSVEFQDWGTQIEFTPNPADPAYLYYRVTSSDARKAAVGVARLETRGLPMLTLYSKDPQAILKRELSFIALYRPIDGAPAILLRNMSSSDLCRFVRKQGSGQ